MTGAGVGRIVTARGYELFTQWMQEADKIRYTPPKTQLITTETPALETQEKQTDDSVAEENKGKFELIKYL